jgi:hypothetical protein
VVEVHSGTSREHHRLSGFFYGSKKVMDMAKIFHLYSNMKKDDLLKEGLELASLLGHIVPVIEAMDKDVLGHQEETEEMEGYFYVDEWLHNAKKALKY